MIHEAIDLDLSGFPSFEFVRTYSSTRSNAGPLGPGWEHNWEHELKFESDGIRIQQGTEGASHHPASDCNGKDGPLVRLDGAQRVAELTFPPYGEKSVFRRDESTAGRWLLAERYDASGNWTRCDYRAGRLIGITDAEHRKIRLTYRQSLLTELYCESPGVQQRIRYDYDPDGRLMMITDPLGAKELFEYARHLIIRHIDKCGLTRFFLYDADHRCIMNWYTGECLFRHLDFSPHGRGVLVKDSYGRRDRYAINEQRLPIMLTDFLGRRFEWMYSDTGLQLCKILPDGAIDQATMEDKEKRTRIVTDVHGAQAVFQLDEHGETRSITNQCGDTITFEKDDRGRLTGILEAGGGRWRYEYDARGCLTRVIDPNGHWLRTHLADGVYRLEDEMGLIATYRFDGLGNMLTSEDALGRIATMEYAGQDRLTLYRSPGGSESRWTYDALSRITSWTDPLQRTSCYRYNPFSSLESVTYPDGSVVRFAVDKEANLVRITNRNNEATQIELDSLQRDVQITYFDGRRRTLQYDELGRVMMLMDADGLPTRFEFEAGALPTRIFFPDGSVQTNTYDGLRRLTSMTLEPHPDSSNPARSCTLAYSPRSQVVHEEHDDFSVDYELDANGRLTAIRNSLGRELIYEYNVRDWVTRLRDASHVYDFDYNLTGELTCIRLPGGLQQRFAYDADSRLIRRDVLSAAGKTLAWRTFAYDAADQLTAMEDWRRGAFRYAYDLRGRLVSVMDGHGSPLETYAYDPESNLLSSPEYASYSYDPGHRLRRADNARFNYDALGAIISCEEGAIRWDYQFDLHQHLVRVSRDGVVLADYEYDLMGRRILKASAASQTRYYYHINQLTTQAAQDGTRWDFLYVPESLVPLAQRNGEQLFFYSFDQIGTPTELWGTEGNLLATVASRAYGSARVLDRIAAGDVPVPFHFQGQYVDEESNLYYNRFRYFSPSLARFISQDPILLQGGLNMYIYPPNPCNWIDPLGLKCASPIALECGVSRNFTPCEAKAAMAKLKVMNKGKRRRCQKQAECRSGQQKKYYENNCSGDAVPKGYDVDHSKEVQQGGSDLCCSNLMPIPKHPNRSMGSQIKNKIECADVGELLPKFSLGSPCNNKAYTAQCKKDFKAAKAKDKSKDDCSDVAKKKDC